MRTANGRSTGADAELHGAPEPILAAVERREPDAVAELVADHLAVARDRMLEHLAAEEAGKETR